jgi:hypothetical protein
MCDAEESYLNPSFDHVVPGILSLASEGLFWFPDLTAFDPGLSAMFGYLCIANAIFGVYKDFTFVGQTTIRGFLQQESKVDDVARVILLAAGGGLFFAIQAPAAIALFCISSSLCAVVRRSCMKRSLESSRDARWKVFYTSSGKNLERIPIDEMTMVDLLDRLLHNKHAAICQSRTDTAAMPEQLIAQSQRRNGRSRARSVMMGRTKSLACKVFHTTRATGSLISSPTSHLLPIGCCQFCLSDAEIPNLCQADAQKVSQILVKMTTAS